MHKLPASVLFLALVAWPAVTAAACPPDAVAVGPLCVDAYEASVWEVLPANTTLIEGIKEGRVTATDLSSDGAVQRGTASADYARGCSASGNGCKDVYAVSVMGVLPSTYITWFQAAAACRNAGKRLLTSAEWQAAAFGTPDGAPCNTTGPGTVGAGSLVGCTSDFGVRDLVGNAWEWVADWQPQASSCGSTWGGGIDDYGCVGLNGPPTAVIRGGSWFSGPLAGVFATKNDNTTPFASFYDVGFRCARPISSAACTTCTCDRNADRMVTIDELVDGVGKALTACE